MQIFFDDILKELRYEDISYEVDFQTGASLQFTLLDDDVELAEAQAERIINSLILEHDVDEMIHHLYISSGIVEIQTGAAEYEDDIDMDEAL